MGHDYIDYEDRHVRLSDWDIWTLRHFFQHVSETTGHDDLGTDQATALLLCRFIRDWDWVCPGVVVGTNISTFVEGHADRVQVLQSLFRRTIAYLHGFGDVIPLEYLQRHVNTPIAIYMVEQPTQRFVKAIEILSEMLRDQ